MILHAVVIDRMVTVIIGIRTPWFIALTRFVRIVIPRGEPNGRNAKFFQVRNAFGDPFEITTVPRPRVLSINSLVVCRITIGKRSVTIR